jgi:hypothetical protein
MEDYVSAYKIVELLLKDMSFEKERYNLRLNPKEII